MDTIDSAYPTILKLLGEYRLSEALELINVDITKVQDWGLKDTFNEIQLAYTYMLQYMEQGIEDPERDTYYQSLLHRCFLIAEKLHWKKQILHSSEFYFTRIRFYQKNPLPTYEQLKLQLENYTEELALTELDNLSNQEKRLQIRKEHEKAHRALFDYTWTSIAWTVEEKCQVEEIMQSVLISNNDKALLISAATMSLFQFFDPEKYLFLITYTNHEIGEIAQRALTGFILTTYFCEKKIQQYPIVQKRIKLMMDQPGIVEAMEHIQLQLLLCRETEKIDRKMREEIIPTIMKNPDIAQMKMGLSEKDEDLDMNEVNPEWQKSMEESGVTEKIEEMAKWQMEGADIYMGTFSQLKNYPFFNKMSNWFYPFDYNHSEVASAFESESEKNMLDMLLNSNHFCNSDKYSFCKTFMNMPTAQRSIIQQQLDGQMEMLKENQAENKKLNTSGAEKISNQYIQDLYRFFKLFSHHNEFEDPFKHSLCLQECSLLLPFYDHKKMNEVLAEFFFKKEYWTEASEILTRTAKKIVVPAETFQKIGFCHQKQKNYEEAITNYEMADIQLPDNYWTLRHLATCYRRIHQYEKAIECYKKASKKKENNKSLLFHFANCYAECMRYEEAIPLYFKWEYLTNGSAKAWRAIAWCLLSSDKLEEALKYYAKIFETTSPTLQDFLNRGHVYFLMGKFKEAIKDYKNCNLRCEKTDEFVQLMKNDRKLLFKNGKKKIELALLIDLAIKG